MTFPVVLALALVVYGTAINVAPVRNTVYVQLNVAAAAVVVLITSSVTGADLAAMGLDAPTAAASVAASAVVVAAVVAVPALVRLGRRSERIADLLADERVRDLGRSDVILRTTLHIPVGTAGFEEIAFRGALLAAFSTVLSTPAAVLASSAAFGLWHLAPTWRYLQVNRVRERLGPLVLAVVATTLAGVALCVLRLVSGGLLLPWAVHAAVNGGALAAAHLHQRD